MWSRAQLKERAKFALKRNYWKTVLVTLIVFLIGGATTDFGVTIEYEDLEAFFAGTISNTYFLGLTSVFLVMVVILLFIGSILLSVFVFSPFG